MKTSKSFRLSVQALQALEYLSSETGTNETAILEMALAYYRKAYNSANLAEISALVGHNLPPSVVDRVTLLKPGQNKKRKRR